MYKFVTRFAKVSFGITLFVLLLYIAIYTLSDHINIDSDKVVRVVMYRESGIITKQTKIDTQDANLIKKIVEQINKINLIPTKNQILQQSPTEYILIITENGERLELQKVFLKTRIISTLDNTTTTHTYLLSPFTELRLELLYKSLTE